MDFQTPPPGLEPEKKNWISTHKILGVVFLVAVIAAIVVGTYYYQISQSMPRTDMQPVHHEKKLTTDWKTLLKQEYGVEFDLLDLKTTFFADSDDSHPLGGSWSIHFETASKAFEGDINGVPPGLYLDRECPNDPSFKAVKVFETMKLSNGQTIKICKATTDDPEFEYFASFVRTNSKALELDVLVPVRDEEGALSKYKQILSTFKFTPQANSDLLIKGFNWTTISSANDQLSYHNNEKIIQLTGKNWVYKNDSITEEMMNQYNKQFSDFYSENKMKSLGWSTKINYRGEELAAPNGDADTASMWGYLKLNGNKLSVIILYEINYLNNWPESADCPCKAEYHVFISDEQTLNF